MRLGYTDSTADVEFIFTMPIVIEEDGYSIELSVSESVKGR